LLGTCYTDAARAGGVREQEEPRTHTCRTQAATTAAQQPRVQELSSYLGPALAAAVVRGCVEAEGRVTRAHHLIPVL